MASSKPLTYPQQIQELKTQLANKQEELDRALSDTAQIPTMEAELNRLREQVQLNSNAAVNEARTDKALQTDLEQRVEQAEVARSQADKEIRNLRAQLAQVETDPNHSEELLRDLAQQAEHIERYRVLNNAAETRINQLQLMLRDVTVEKQAEIDALNSLVSSLRIHNQAATKLVNEIRMTLEQAPDVVAQLKLIAGIK